MLLGNVPYDIRLVNLKPEISVLAGGKRPTGQTAPEKEAVLRKIDLIFFQPLISIKWLILC